MSYTEAIPWLSKLLSVSGPAEIRDALAAAHPEFAADRFRRCALLGAGPEGLRFAEICAQLNITLVMVADDRLASSGQDVAGHPIVPSERLLDCPRDVPIIVASHRGHGARKRLRKSGFAKVELLSLLQVLDPQRFPPHMFFCDLLETTVAGRDRVATLAGRLADDLSRATLDALIGFRLTLDPDLLEPVSDLDVYYPKGLITLDEHEVYVDGGTFDGDSIGWFIERTKNRFDRVIGFEPDPRTFDRLVENFRHEPRVSPVNAGLWSKPDTLRFHNDASRGAILSDQGSCEVAVTSLDEIMKGDRVTYIKMNIEGAETEALRGASRTIQTWTPRLAISIYHRPDDFWTIPALIDSIRPGYRMFLRQQDLGVSESVLFALL